MLTYFTFLILTLFFCGLHIYIYIYMVRADRHF